MKEQVISYHLPAIKDRVYIQCHCGYEILEFALMQYYVLPHSLDRPEVNLYFHGESRQKRAKNLDFYFTPDEFSRLIGNWEINLPEEDELLFTDSRKKGGYMVLRNEGFGYFSLSRYENLRKLKKDQSNWVCILAAKEFEEAQEALENLYATYDKLEAEYE